LDKGFFKGVVLGAVVSTVVLIAATAFAGSGKGGIFNLGVNNTVDATTKLHGAAQGAMLNITNAGSEPGSSGLVVGAGSTPPAIRGANSGTGPGVKGTGVSGPGVLGQSTTGTGVQAAGAGSQPALQATNTGTGPGAAFLAGGTAPPFTVSSSTKVTDLNADQLDGIDSTGFVNGGAASTRTESSSASIQRKRSSLCPDSGPSRASATTPAATPRLSSGSPTAREQTSMSGG